MMAAIVDYDLGDQLQGRCHCPAKARPGLCEVDTWTDQQMAPKVPRTLAAIGIFMALSLQFLHIMPYNSLSIELH